MYDFNLICCDADSITICKKNETAFTDQEISKLTNELNSLFEEGIS